MLITSLVPDLDLEHAGDAAPEARRPARAASIGTRKAARSGRPRRRRTAPTRRGGDAADRDLALAADVGEVGAVGEDEAEADQRQRHAAVDRGGHAHRASRRRRRRRPPIASGTERADRRDQQQADDSAADERPRQRHQQRRPQQAGSRLAAAQCRSRRVMRLPRHHGADALALAPARRAARPSSGRDRARRCDRRRRAARRARDEISSTPTPRRAGGADLAVDRLDRADVEAARRLRREQEHQRFERDLARQHRLLLVAAGQAARTATSGPAARTSKRCISSRAARRSAARSSRPKRREAIEPVQEQVLGHATCR